MDLVRKEGVERLIKSQVKKKKKNTSTPTFIRIKRVSKYTPTERRKRDLLLDTRPFYFWEKVYRSILKILNVFHSALCIKKP